MSFVGMLPLVALFSWGLTGVIRLYAVKHLLDIPNARSSHQVATPKGGGLAIVLSFLLGVVVSWWFGEINTELCRVLMVSSLVAIVGFWDDHHHLSARWRLLCYLLVASVIIGLLNGTPPLAIAGFTVNLGWLGYLLGLLSLVWWLNLFNFMDGTDGLAASEAVFITGTLAAFLYFIHLQLSYVALLLSCASLGFLFWNWPKARIFMGDVGSVFLGLVSGTLILMAAHQSPVFLSVGLILSAVFVFVATYTLFYRFLTAQKWYDAHCSHAYQQAAKRYGHSSVLLAVWLINICWLLPWAVLTFYFPAFNAVTILIAYLPLLFLTVKLGAGVP